MISRQLFADPSLDTRLARLLERKSPDAFRELMLIAEKEQLSEEREMCELSLLEFIKAGWKHAGESNDFTVNWHHEVIIDHLEAITRGELRNLIINVPPRHSKSRIVNIFFPAWTWIRKRYKNQPLSGPHVKFFCVSYAASLAEEHAQRMLWLLRSDWFQLRWGHVVQLQPDQSARANFSNTAGGERISSSIEGGLLGRGGDIQICDDPHSTKSAESDIERDATIRAFGEGLSTRITDPRIAARVLIMQRLHEMDATNWALEHWPSATTVHLLFPARFDMRTASPLDMRTNEGEILWPEVWSKRAIDEKEFELGPYGFSGQYQQLPSPRVGGIIDRNDWMIYPEETPRADETRVQADGTMVVPLPELSYVVAGLDTAMSEDELADWNALVILGVWHRRRNLSTTSNPFISRWAPSVWTPEDLREQILAEDEQPRMIMMEAWQRRCKLNDDTKGRDGKPQGLVQRVIETCRRRKVDRLIIENKTRGKDVKDEIVRQLRGEEFQIDMFEPNKHGNKVARLYSVQPLFSQGLIYAPGNCIVKRDPRRGEYVDVEEFQWVNAVRDQIQAMPRGAHDDLVDATTMGLIWLRENGFLSLNKEYVEEMVHLRGLRADKRPGGKEIAEHYGV